MTITISNYVFYYWIFSIIFEAIYLYVSWRKIKKSVAFYFFETFFNVTKKTYSKIFFIEICILSIFNFVFTSPIFLILYLLRRIINLFSKSKLEKEAEDKQEEDKEFSENEGDLVDDENSVKEKDSLYDL